MSEIDITQFEAEFRDPREQLFEYAEHLFEVLAPDKISRSDTTEEWLRETATVLDDGSRVEIGHVFDHGWDKPSMTNLVFLEIGTGKRTTLTIDYTSYAAKQAGEKVEDEDLEMFVHESTDPRGEKGLSKINEEDVESKQMRAEILLSDIMGRLQVVPSTNWFAPKNIKRELIQIHQALAAAKNHQS